MQEEADEFKNRESEISGKKKKKCGLCDLGPEKKKKRPECI